MTWVHQTLGTAGSAAGLTAAAGAVVLVLRELTGALIAVWSMLTEKPEKREQALAILCFIWPRRGEKLRARLASVKAQVPRQKKPPAKKNGEEKAAVGFEPTAGRGNST